MLPEDEENEVLNETDITALIPSNNNLDKQNTELVKQIIEENDANNLKKLIQLFNLAQTKKNAYRTIKLNQLMGKVEDEMCQRLNEGKIEDNDLVKYYKVIQDSLDKNESSFKTINENPVIQFNQVNINNTQEKDNELSRESKEKIKEIIKNILNKPNSFNDESSDEVIIPEVTLLKEEEEEGE